MDKWAYEKNAELGIFPHLITTGSGKQAWWQCASKHHLYQRSIDKEAARSPQCPICRKANNVSERPDLMDKWAYEKNAELGIFPHLITTGSGNKVWWQCIDKHHLYQRSIENEATRNPQCPVCKDENQKHLSDYPELLKEFAYELNDINPEELTAGSDTRVTWQCEKHGHVWATTPYHRTKEKTGCPYCSNKKVLQGFNDLLTINPPNLRYWDYDKNNKDGIIITNYTPTSEHKAWWYCDNGHLTYDTIANVIKRKTTPCSECQKEKNLASSAAAVEKKKRHEAYAKRRKESKTMQESRILANQKSLLEKRKRFIAIVDPYWDYDENQKRGFKLENMSTNRAYCFKCSKGHKWKSELLSMLENPGCPECTIEETSISKKYPYLATIYDIKMNRGIPPEICLAVDSKYYWWTCRNGHTFLATLGNVAKHKETGCMFCDKRKSFYSL